MKLLMPVEVAAIRAATPRIRHLTLRPLKRAAFPRFKGGAHTILLLPDGKRRLYSLASDPAREEVWEIAVLREAESLGGSIWLHEAVEVGTRFHASWPQQGFALAPDASRHVLIAGGVGITPFRAMLPELERAGADFVLHYAARTRAEAAFLDELEGQLGPRLVVWLSGEGRRLDLAGLLRAPRAGTHVYCCGPARMLEVLAAASADWPAEAIHTEHFTGIDRATARQGDPFEVEIASSGRVLQVPAERSLLEVLREAGFVIDSSCEYGACGTCIVDVAAGEPIHRDVCLSAKGRVGRIATCVSRGKGRLRLAL